VVKTFWRWLKRTQIGRAYLVAICLLSGGFIGFEYLQYDVNHAPSRYTVNAPHKVSPAQRAWTQNFDEFTGGNSCFYSDQAMLCVYHDVRSSGDCDIKNRKNTPIGNMDYGSTLCNGAYLSSTELAKYKPIFKRRVFYDSYMEVLDYAKPFVWGLAQAIGFWLTLLAAHVAFRWIRSGD
jgi:hypothetical protein